MSDAAVRVRARVAWVALACVLAALLVARVRLAPPPPLDATAAATLFSAGRAHVHLPVIAGEPHPVGSRANERVATYIEETLRALEYAPSRQAASVCDDSGACVRVTNVLARLRGTGPEGGKAVLVTAHYDSVEAGPGASDNGVGVAAVLEVARALKASAALRNDVVFLFSDGEESGASGSTHPGLRGAKSFAASAAASIGAVVNLDARGTSGPSLMFETSNDDAWLVRLYARAASRPATSSVLTTIYRQLPAATDFTTYRAAGLPGLNFALADGVSVYHTPLDDVAHVSDASLQHHGENALALARALGAVDLASPPAGDAVFFDVLGAVTLWWPARWAPALGAIPLLLLGVGAARSYRASELRPRDFARGALALLAVAISVGAAVLLAVLLRFPSSFVAEPLPALLAFAAIPVAAMALARDPEATWTVTWSAWAIAGLVLSIAAPGASYPFVVPAFVAAALMLARQPAAAAAVPPVVACILLAPLAFLVHGSLGTKGLIPVAEVGALVALAAAPLFAALSGRPRAAIHAVAAVMVIAGAIASRVVPSYSPAAPEGVSICFHHDVTTHHDRYLVSSEGALPRELGAGFGGEGSAFTWGARPAFPWWADDPRAIAAPTTDLPSPELTDVESSALGANKRLRAKLRSPRAAHVAGIAFPPQVKIVSIALDGQAVPPLDPDNLLRQDGWKVYTSETVGADGLALDVVLEAITDGEVVLFDQTPGVPASSPKRPSWAAAQHGGDTTVVSRSVPLPN